jgi:hypothetical protein
VRRIPKFVSICCADRDLLDCVAIRQFSASAGDNRPGSLVGGARSVAESVLVGFQLLILNRSRKVANLRPSDRVVAGLCALHAPRPADPAIVVKRQRC